MGVEPDRRREREEFADTDLSPMTLFHPRDVALRYLQSLGDVLLSQACAFALGRQQGNDP